MTTDTTSPTAEARELLAATRGPSQTQADIIAGKDDHVVNIGYALRAIDVALASRPTAAPDGAEVDEEEEMIGEMAAFGASETACYLYPGVDQVPERAAYCKGAYDGSVAIHRKRHMDVVQPSAEVREALAWYGEQARLCRLIHSEGDAGRHALDADGGERAKAALSTPPAVSREAGWTYEYDGGAGWDTHVVLNTPPSLPTKKAPTKHYGSSDIRNVRPFYYAASPPIERARVERETIEALVNALKTADDAIREMFRYFDGGETRGSYDGKPERNQLRKAGYATTAALRAFPVTQESGK